MRSPSPDSATEYMFSSTVFGRQLLATGENENAAWLCGIATDRLVFWAHAISGFLAALAGVLFASMLGSAAPEMGDSWLIGSFAVAIIGGTGLNGGVISITGIFLGGAVFMLIKYGLVEIKANPYFANSFLGPLSLLAIILDRVREIVAKEVRNRSSNLITDGWHAFARNCMPHAYWIFLRFFQEYPLLSATHSNCRSTM
jgi:ribose transport system permease protein